MLADHIVRHFICMDSNDEIDLFENMFRHLSSCFCGSGFKRVCLRPPGACRPERGTYQ